MPCFDSDSRLSKECFETIFQTMAEGVFIIDTTGTIRLCNQGLARMSGFAVESIIGKRCRDIMVCACESMAECELLGSGALNSIECELRRSDHTLLPVLKNGRVMVDGSGRTIGGVETLVDISALRLAQRKNASLEEEAARGGGKMGLLIGKSRPMQTVFDLIGLAAASNATVLITGETGTGKELVARSIHDAGRRSAGPLVKVNCSALPEPLLESELFGHVKGAFTGAIKDKVGRFELADGGTLFLDEIGDISPFIQVKLLRFLQERDFERVGESVTRKADVRIIAATNRDLRDLMRAGAFREDLLYRLKVFPIHLPPLRERKEDIGLLINHFIEKFGKQTGKPITGLTPEAALTLMDYCWPGNIRELENAIEHAFVTCREGEIGIFDVPLEIRHVELRPQPCPRPDGRIPTAPAAPAPKCTLTKELLLSTLERRHGNKTETALELGIDRTTLWRYMKRWKL